MTDPEARAPIRRILVALDASGASLAALDAAARLAATLEAELLGLFVEDEDLLRLAGLPCAREVGFTFTQARRMESADMERAHSFHRVYWAGAALALRWDVTLRRTKPGLSLDEAYRRLVREETGRDTAEDADGRPR